VQKNHDDRNMNACRELTEVELDGVNGGMFNTSIYLYRMVLAMDHDLEPIKSLFNK